MNTKKKFGLKQTLIYSGILVAASFLLLAIFAVVSPDDVPATPSAGMQALSKPFVHAPAIDVPAQQLTEAIPLAIMTVYGSSGCVEWTNDPAVVLTCPAP